MSDPKARTPLDQEVVQDVETDRSVQSKRAPEAAAAQSSTVVDYTIGALRESIREGRLAQGQRLVVADVTRMLGVSSGPVREAIRRLTGEGLVEIVPHRGAAVREFSSRDIHEIYEVREVLEGLAARLSAERIAAVDYRARLKEIMTDIRAALASKDGRIEQDVYTEHNHLFHELIYEMAGNEWVCAQLRQLSVPIYRLRFHRLIDPAYAPTATAEHEIIAKAILDGDGPLAERMMRNHLHNSARAVLDALDAEQRRSIETRMPRRA